MNENILQMLKLLRDKLPSQALLSDGSSKSQLYDSLSEKLVQNIDKLKRVEDLTEIESEELTKLYEEYEQVVDDYEILRMEVDSEYKSKELYDADANRELTRCNILKKRIEKESDEEVKKELQSKLEESEKAYKDNVEWSNESESNYLKMKDELEKINGNKERLSKRIEIEREVEQQEYAKRYDEKLEQRRKEVDIVRGKLGYLNIGSSLDSLIDDYENGRTNDAEVNYRMRLLQSQLQNPNIRVMVNHISEEQKSLAEDQIDSMSEQVTSLKNKLSDDNNYIMSEDEYQSKLKDLNNEYIKLNKRYINCVRRRDDTLRKMEDLTSNASLDGHLKVTADKEYKRLNKLLLKQKKDLSDLNEILLAKELEIDKFESYHGKVNEEEKNQDFEKLNKLENDLREIKYFNVLDPLSVDERINAILNATKSEDEYLKDFVSKESGEPENKIDESKDASDEEIIEKPTLDDNEDDFEPIFPRIKEEDMDLGEKPVLEPDKVKAVKEPKPSLLNKLKKLWKKAKAWIAAALILAGIGGSGVAVKNYVDKLNNEKEVQDVVNSVVSKETLNALKVVISKCNNVDSSLYTKDSYNVMMNKVNYVQALIDNNALTEDSAKKYITELQEAYNNLVPINKLDKEESNKTPTNPSDSSNTDSGTNDKDDEPEFLEKGEQIILMPGDSVETEFGSVDYDGVQRDNNGNEIGTTDVEKQEDGSVIIEDDDLVRQETLDNADVDLENQIVWEDIGEPVQLDSQLENFQWDDSFEFSENEENQQSLGM